jgi:hydroxyacylglutathione hydrolase
MSGYMTLHIETISLGPLETNCYVLWRSAAGRSTCWIVDVAMWSKPMVEFLRERNLAPGVILLTHGHGDHIGGVEYVMNAFPDARLYCPAADEPMLQSPELNLSATFLMGIQAPPAHELLRPGQTLQMDDLAWQVLDTSGHTPGGMSYYCPAEGVVFTGDSLFAGSIGRTDIPNGDGDRLLDNIRRHLLKLPDETRIYPGHGPATTIGREKQTNPFGVRGTDGKPGFGLFWPNSR